MKLLRRAAPFTFALSTLIIPAVLTIVFQGKKSMAPIVSMSYLTAIGVAGWRFGAAAGVLTAGATVPLLTVIATHGHTIVPPHIDIAAMFVLVGIAFLSSRIRNAELRVRQVLVDANEALERRVQERTEELARARDWLSTTLRSIGDAVIATDASGTITFLNAVAAGLTGWTVDDAVGHPLEEVFSIVNESTRRAVESPVTKVLRSGTVVGLANHTVLLARDGREIPIDDSGAPIRDKDGSIIGVVLVFRDISERRAAETERERLGAEVRAGELRLREAAKLESLGILAGGIAHDFNNILVGIIGGASLALDMLPEQEPARALIEELMRASEKAAVLTKQMLAYSGKGRFLVEALDLSRSIEEIIPILTRSHPAALVEARLERALPAIDADRSQIQQVAMNLILNAIEACTSGRGTVTVTTRSLDLAPGGVPCDFGLPPVEPGRHVCLEVRDTGSGMPEEVRARIFDPFFTTKFTGRGLGLSAVLGIIRGHRGAVTVESTVGRGTTFRVYLPATAKTVTEPPAQPQLKALRGTGTILVADDEEVVRRVARLSLERCGYRVMTVENGAEAVRAVRENPGRIDLVILDLTMPVLGGEEAVDQIMRIDPSAKVLLSSGFSASEAIERFRGKPLSGFLQKPYTSSALAEQVRSVVGRAAPEARGAG